MRGDLPRDEPCQHARRSSSGGSAAANADQSFPKPHAAARRAAPGAGDGEVSREQHGRVQRWLERSNRADSWSSKDRIPAAWITPSSQHMHWLETSEAVSRCNRYGHTDRRHQADGLDRGHDRSLEAMGRVPMHRSASPDAVTRNRQHGREMVSAATLARHRSVSPDAVRRVAQDGSFGHGDRRHVSRDRGRSASPPLARSVDNHPRRRNEAIDLNEGQNRSSRSGMRGADGRREEPSFSRHRSVSPAALRTGATDGNPGHTSSRHVGGLRARSASPPSAELPKRERPHRSDAHGMAEAARQLQASYAEWQRATRHLIAVGHRATRHRRWKTCGRAFQVCFYV